MIFNTKENKITPVLSIVISYIYTFIFENPQILFKNIVNPNKKKKSILEELGLTEDDITEEVFY